MTTGTWRLYPPPTRYGPSVGDEVFVRSKSAKELGKKGKVVSLISTSDATDAAEDVKPSTEVTTPTDDLAGASPTKKSRKGTEEIRAVINLHSNNEGSTSSATNSSALEVTARPSRLVPIYAKSTDNTQESATAPLTTVIVTPDTTNYRILAASQVHRRDHVLEIGCSTGECTSILARYVASTEGKVGRVIAFDTGEGMIQTAKERVESLDLHGLTMKFHKIDALQDPRGAFSAAACTNVGGYRSVDYPKVMFIDIGGNRELDGVVRMIDWVMDAFKSEPPRLICVKSQELADEIMAASRNDKEIVAIDGSGVINNGVNWFDRLADRLASVTETKRQGNGPPGKFSHPLKAPLSLSPVDDATPICRFHNYHRDGCRKDGECEFDHVHCHWCLKQGHVARNCKGENEECFDFCATPLRVVTCHAEGEVGDVIVSGVAGNIPGDTLWEKSRYIARDGRLRNYVLQEPRGGVFRHVNLLVKPINPKAKVAFIIMEPEDTPPMSGSNSICVATVALQTGLVPITGNDMSFKMEAPGGLVSVNAKCSGGKATQIKITNVPSFAGIVGATLEVESVGMLTVDTAFGGDSFVICNADDIGFKIMPEEAKDLVDVGMKIVRAANEQLKFVHPTNKDITHFSFCMIAKPIFYENGVAISHTAVAIQPGKIDRSPTGTGCSARMALLHAKGELKLGDRMIGRSIIGSEFDCRIEEELDLNNSIKAIRPSVAGRAWITGTSEYRLDPADPYSCGYRLSDTWPKKTLVRESARKGNLLLYSS